MSLSGWDQALTAVASSSINASGVLHVAFELCLYSISQRSLQRITNALEASPPVQSQVNTGIFDGFDGDAVVRIILNVKFLVGASRGLTIHNTLTRPTARAMTS